MPKQVLPKIITPSVHAKRTSKLYEPNNSKKGTSNDVPFFWGQIDKVRTFLLESINDEDSFLRTLDVA